MVAGAVGVPAEEVVLQSCETPHVPCPATEQLSSGGPPVPEQDLAAVLTNAEKWEYPRSGTWLGCLTLTLTEAGRKIVR